MDIASHKPGIVKLSRHLSLPYLVIWLAVIICSLWISIAAQAAHPQLEDIDKEIPFALAVRGGVSLGSYEAGINWATIKYMKTLRRSALVKNKNYIELKAVSGASAGSINSLITAILWCVDDSAGKKTGLFPNTLTENLFHDSWIGVGFDELLPEPVDSKSLYRADDGVLTRNAFNPAIRAIKKALDSNVFRPGCRVPVGVLVTSVKPVTMTVAGVDVHNQRFMVPIELFTDTSGRAGFSLCNIDRHGQVMGNILLLPGKPVSSRHCPYLIQTNDVIDTIEASSAFPLAFGRKQLRYCERTQREGADQNEKTRDCPVGYRTEVADFVDGGLFDNIPLGAAKALAEPQELSERTRKIWQRSARRYNYIYLDPTIRRPTGQKKEMISDPPVAGESVLRTFGLRSQTGFLLGAIETGRDYELYNVLRGGEWGNQVFSYSRKLSAAIARQYGDQNITQPDVSLLQCRSLFARPITIKRASSRQMALACVKNNIQSLEMVYTGQAIPGKRNTSADNITRLRNETISWITRLATAIGDKQLALTVQETRKDKLGDRRILLSRRFSPLTGEMIFFFGAFADPDFRKYDYFAGIYDAVWGIANFICERRPDIGRCTPEKMGKIYQALGIDKNIQANTVFMYLLEREFPKQGRYGSHWSWASTQATQEVDRNLLAIANSLFGETLSEQDQPYEAPKIGLFISRLTKEDYDTSQSSEFLRRIFSLKGGDELSWYYPLTLRASNRLLLLEKRERDVRKRGDIYGVGLAAGAFLAHSYIREEEFTLNSSTAPDFSWQAWLPYEIAVDARNGGLDVSWEPSVNLGDKGYGLALKVTPVRFNRFGGQDIWFSSADLFFAYRRQGLFSSVGAGPTFSYTWQQWPDSTQTSVGASAYVGLLQDKLRVTAGAMSGIQGTFPGDTYYLNFGLTDIPGIVYWLSKAN